MKILIIVLSHDNEIYTKFYRAQKETWDSIYVSGVETYYLFGNHNCDEIVSDKIMVDVSENTNTDLETICGHKTIKSFLLTNELNYDYIFRTNSSSYVDKKLLLEFIRDKPKNKYYSGTIGWYRNIKFASGSGYFLSKDLVQYVIQNSNKWDHNLIDDVALANLLQNYNIYPSLNQRIDICDDFNIPNNYYHYRFKTNDRLDDIRRMYLTHNLKK